MRTKPCIVGTLLLLALTCAGSKYAFTATTAVSASVKSENPAQWKTIPEDSTRWRREPFKSSESPKDVPKSPVTQRIAGESSDLSLQGIMTSNKHYYAIINGRTVKPGDHIDGWTIADISRQRVTVKREKEKQIYDIYKGRLDRGIK
jgi:hypothetical protein